MAGPLVVYYECLDDPMAGSYAIPVSDLLRRVPAVDLVTVDSFSDSLQLQLVREAIIRSARCLLIADSRQGQGAAGLTALIEPLRKNEGHLIWLGDHPLRARALAMTQGVRCVPDDLSRHLGDWISVY